ncbi:V-set and transmembrane domain-containing protein 2-like protein [Dunckerocampus dactyliophorus]|uniref:V-set and transmembrane domain-containing protein 2-like protein n=1 Tax=Dunckerocampus dactyliophorus TaxID=161453 RepID=UPI002405F400|nr:V-set and transmembrane domain-containing protein 2-like protein [Dunckerocampus dactyliophorus]
MGALKVLLGTLHYVGLCVQLGVSTSSSKHTGHGHKENHIIHSHAMFTEVPHDVTAHRGQDVEMACSFRGAGTPSYSLEIQWWYIRNHVDWTDRQPWETNEVAPEEEMPKDATKISVVKVVGSNISHKLRLSRVKSSDEGTYECRVIDFSDEEAGVRHHRVRAYLQVVAESDIVTSNQYDNFQLLDDTKRQSGYVEGEFHSSPKGHAHSQPQSEGRPQGHSKRPSSPAPHHSHPGRSDHQQAGRELRKRDVDSNHSNNDCSNEPSCVL